ncbi:MAG: UDP-N-acetylmuramoyl-tripeptide--D-alanyl-D-alanine ligase [bacterium]
MEPIKIDEILQAIEGELLQGDKDKWIAKISTDSRQITQGDLFIALKGDRFDGHDFVEEVIKKEAGALVISKDIQPVTSYQLPITIIKVRDTLIALGKIAAYYRQKFEIPIVAITGSNGKTTTKEMAWQLISQKLNTLKCKGSFNNAIGLPLTLLELKNTTQSAVVEIGMNQVGEIKYLATIAKPTVALITNIGESHIGYLKTKENIANEKAQILDAVKDKGIAILNLDDDYSNRMKFKGRLITYGIRNSADINAQDIHQDINGIKFTLILANNHYKLAIPILGLHNVYNVLGATAIAYALGLNFDEIKDAYKDFKTPYGRMELRSHGKIKIINDAYNANPTSMKAAVQTLNQIHTKGRKILVMGDMLELGELSESFHRAIAKEIVTNGVDVLFTIGENASLTSDEAHKVGLEVYKCDSNEEIVSKLKSMLKAGDSVLVKGSRRMKLEEVVEALKKVESRE